MELDEYLSMPEPDREAYLTELSESAQLQLGVDLYNDAHYWHAHEAWEAAWMDAPRELRLFYQGLIQITAAFVHVVRNEYPGSVRLLAAGIEKLEGFPESMNGIALAKLIEAARMSRSQLLTLGEKRIREFDRASIPRIEITASPQDIPT